MSKRFKDLPPAILRLLEKPPLIKGENPIDFFDLVDFVIAGTDPGDPVEWLWMIQFVYASWDALRFRRLRAVYLDSRHDHALHTLLRNARMPRGSSTLRSADHDHMCRLVDGLVEQCKTDPGQMIKHKISPDLVPATAIIQIADKLNTFDRMIDRAEQRCDVVIQQLEVRRAVFAAKAHDVADRLRLERQEVGRQPLLLECEAVPIDGDRDEGVAPPTAAEADANTTVAAIAESVSPPIVPDVSGLEQDAENIVSERQATEASAEAISSANQDQS